MQKDMQFEFISKKLIFLYVSAKDLNMKISSLSFSESKILITLEAKEKNSVYTFLKIIKNGIIENMKFDDNTKRYIAHASFKINRR